MDIEPPRIRPSLLPMAAQCRLRFRREVDGGVGMLRFSRANRDRAFEVRHRVIEAIEDAHLAGEAGLDGLLHLDPPEGLLAEERWLFRRALDHYVELAGERPGTVVDLPERFATLAHSSGRFALSLRLDLCFAVQEGVELRRVAFGPARVPPAEDDRVLAVAIHLARQGHAAVRVVHLDLLHGEASEALLDRDALTAAGVRIGETVLAALDDPSPAATPGWWCHECPALRACPAVSQQAPAELVLLATGEVGEAPADAGAGGA